MKLGIFCKSIAFQHLRQIFVILGAIGETGIGFSLIFIYAVFMPLMFPKPPPRPKKKRKPIQRKSKFKLRNPTKVYHEKYTKEEVKAFAESSRAQRLANSTMAEKAFAQILRSESIAFEREKIFFYNEGQIFIMADFFLPRKEQGRPDIIVECDGKSHGSQLNYDKGRDRYLATLGIRTFRVSNAEIMRQPEGVRQKILEVLNER